MSSVIIPSSLRHVLTCLSYEIVKPVAIVVNQLPIRLSFDIIQFTERQRDKAALHSSFAEDAVHLVDHWLVGVAEANHGDALRMSVLFAMFGFERKH